MARPAAERAEIFVVSDGTGDTAAAAVEAAMLQFHTPWRVRRFRDVRHASQVRRIVELAQSSASLIVFTLVEKRVAQELRDRGALLGVPTVDLLGSLISKIAQHLRAEPRLEPGLLHGFSDEYFARIEAVEYAVRHDDGANLDTLFEADIVLTGVSRTSKTPLTMYLAQRGFRTANIPLVPGVPPPRALLEMDKRRVFGLTIAPETLVTVRKNRERILRALPYGSYAQREEIVRELETARRLFRREGWRVIDISGRAVEENAAQIIEYLEEATKPRLER
ncbi:MAG: kinase/pyrophosphorylase [Deltaproteobacteria bacterium]|nr:MAG: kinase/pyrophosphorylase [Deltaproteobacteria bacterium]